MKKNNEKNKFKLVKYKRKLVAASFGAIVPLITSVSAITNNSQAHNASSLTSEQQKNISDLKQVRFWTNQTFPPISQTKYAKIFVDSEKTIWMISFDTHGTLYYKKKGQLNWSSLHITDIGTNRPWPSRSAMYEDNHKNIYFAFAYESNAIKIDMKTHKHTFFATKLKGMDPQYKTGVGLFLEDSLGNLWGIGDQGSFLIKMKPHESEFKISSIDNPYSISGLYVGPRLLIEDSNHNIWTSSAQARIQVKNVKNSTWDYFDYKDNFKAKGKTHLLDTMIFNKRGYKMADNSFIFEDSEKNLWFAGKDAPLQEMKKGTKTWVNANSNIKDGQFATIFEDSQGNLWASAQGYALQEKKKNEDKWTEVKSNIVDGQYLKIFEDSEGTIWTMSQNKPLQYKTKNSEKWQNANNGSNIKDGFGGSIKEDAEGNLWASGNNTPIQVLPHKIDEKLISQQLFDKVKSEISKSPSDINKPQSFSVSGKQCKITKWEQIDQNGTIHWELEVKSDFNTKIILSGNFNGFKKWDKAKILELNKNKTSALSAITNIQPSKTLVAGAIEPASQKTAFDAAVTKAKQAITDATDVAGVNSAKASGSTSVTAARDALDGAIEVANQAKETSDLANAKATAIQAITNIQPSKTLVAGAIEPATERATYNNAVDAAKQAIIDATDVASFNSAKASGTTSVTAARDALDRAIEAANQAKETSDLANAKATAIQAITNIQSSKTLVAGAIEPATARTTYNNAVDAAKQAITDAEKVADVNSAKTSGVTTVTAARDALDSAIEAANQAKFASDLADAKTTALQAIDNIKSQKTLVTGATEPTSEKTAFDAAVTKAKKAITDAEKVADVNSAKTSGVTTVTTARDALDSAIEAANQAKVASDLANAKTTALQAIDNIKSQKTLVTEATEPTSEKTAFDAAVTKAKKAITDAEKVADVNSAKASGVTTVTAARDALDSAIEAANQAKVASDDLVRDTNEGALNLPRINSNKLPSTVVKPQDKILNNGVKVAFTTWTSNDVTGTIAWGATVSKGNASKILSGTLKNYETTTDVANVANKEAVNGISLSDLNLPKINNAKLPSLIKKPDTITLNNGVKVTFTTWTSNDVTGTIAWGATVSKGDASKILSGTLKNYKTTTDVANVANKEAVNRINKSDLNLPNVDNKKLPSLIKKPDTITLNNGVKVTFTTWTPDNQKGSILWSVTASKGNASKILDGTLKHYQTQENAEKQLLDKAKLKAIETINQINQSQKLIDGAKLENSNFKMNFINDIKKAKSLINKTSTLDDVYKAKKQAVIELTIERDQLDKAILAANETQEAKVLKESITKITKDLVLKAKDYIEPVKDGTLFDKNAFEKLGGNIKDFPKVPENWKITYSDEEDINNGFLNVHIKILNLNNDNKLQEINPKINIQEIDMKKAKASKDIFITEEKFEKFNHTISKLENRKKILPSSLDNITSPKELGIVIPNDLPKEVKIDYSVNGYNDKKGTINVKASISKNEGTPKKVEFTLEGFKKSINILNHNDNKPNSKNGVSKTAIVIISISTVLSIGITVALIKMILSRKGKKL